MTTVYVNLPLCSRATARGQHGSVQRGAGASAPGLAGERLRVGIYRGSQRPVDSLQTTEGGGVGVNVKHPQRHTGGSLHVNTLSRPHVAPGVPGQGRVGVGVAVIVTITLGVSLGSGLHGGVGVGGEPVGGQSKCTVSVSSNRGLG
jgi:hypothetical protein